MENYIYYEEIAVRLDPCLKMDCCQPKTSWATHYQGRKDNVNNELNLGKIFYVDQYTYPQLDPIPQPSERGYFPSVELIPSKFIQMKLHIHFIMYVLESFCLG